LLGFFGKSGEIGAVSQVVMVSIGDTVRAVGLLTRERFDGLPAGLGGEGYVAVYVPFSYQIGGFTLILPSERVEPLDMSLEDAMRFIVTAGATGKIAAPAPAQHRRPFRHPATARVAAGTPSPPIEEAAVRWYYVARFRGTRSRRPCGLASSRSYHCPRDPWRTPPTTSC
jgi:hypothetical protein